MTRIRSRSRAALFAAALIAGPLALSPFVAPPAHAFTVFDPWNYSQNILTAARTLEQINQEITSLQNEAQMLINQARNLASLPYSSLQQLQQSVQRTQQLLNEAQSIAFDVQKIDLKGELKLSPMDDLFTFLAAGAGRIVPGQTASKAIPVSKPTAKAATKRKS